MIKLLIDHQNFSESDRFILTHGQAYSEKIWRKKLDFKKKDICIYSLSSRIHRNENGSGFFMILETSLQEPLSQIWPLYHPLQTP